MSAKDTLRQVAEMLPDDRRERFLLMCTRFQNVPEDDEYLIILEVIGLMTLLWKEVPQEIAQVLEKATPIGSNHQHLELLIQQAVQASIPSFEDLKRMAERLENHEATLKRVTQVKTTPDQHRQIPRRWLWFVAGFSANFLFGYFLYRVL